jgi:glycine/D-amino acid oxidase-like deaminating enzyme
MSHVLVVGAGLLGSAVAYHLARSGAAVTVLERGRPGGGTSGATFAWLNAQDKAPAAYFELNGDGITEHARLAAELGGDWHHPGGDLVIGTGDGVAAVRARIDRHAGLGYPVRTLSREELAALEPSIEPGDGELLIGHFHGEAWIDPPALIGRFLGIARARGATVRTGATVAGIAVDGGRAVGVDLADGSRLAADAVVVAAGPASPVVVATAGVELPMRPSPGLLVVSEPVAAGIGHVVHAGDVSLRPDGGGRVMLASRAVDATLEPGTRELAADAPAVAGILETGARLVPALRGVRAESVRIGIRSVPADGLPVAGFSQQVEGLYLLVTHSGATLAALLGRLVAAELLGRPEARLEPYRPTRPVAVA